MIKRIYKMYPSIYLKDNYDKTDPLIALTLYNEFDTLEAACDMAKKTHICLREQNWYVYEYLKILFFRFKIRRIFLLELYNSGKFFRKKKEFDDHGLCYVWKGPKYNYNELTPLQKEAIKFFRKKK